MCLPLLIFPCTIKSRSSLLAPAQPGWSWKRAVIRLWLWCSGIIPYLISLEEATDSAEARVDFEPCEDCISCVHRSVHNSEVLWYFQWHCQQASHTVHSTLCTVHCAWYTAPCTLHRAPCMVHCALNARTCSRQTSHRTNVALPPDHTTTTTILWSLYRTTCVSWHHQLRTGEFCRSKALPATCSCR